MSDHICKNSNTALSIELLNSLFGNILEFKNQLSITNSDCNFKRFAAICITCCKVVSINNEYTHDQLSSVENCASSKHFLYLRLFSPYEIYCVSCKDYHYNSKYDSLISNSLIQKGINQSVNTCLGSFKPHIGDCAYFNQLNDYYKTNKINPVTYGLCNMGSTCFLSSVTQSLLHIPLLQYYFLNANSAEYKCHKCFIDETNFAVCIPCNMKQLYCVNDSSNSNGKNAITPVPMIGNHRKKMIVPSFLLYALWKHCEYLVCLFGSMMHCILCY